MKAAVEIEESVEDSEEGTDGAGEGTESERGSDGDWTMIMFVIWHCRQPDNIPGNLDYHVCCWVMRCRVITANGRVFYRIMNQAA